MHGCTDAHATSCTCQARQSYTVDDICWDATFVPAARRQPDGGVRVDFDKMHEVHPLGHILPAYLPTYSRTYVLTYLRTYLRTYVRTYLRTDVLTYLCT